MNIADATVSAARKFFNKKNIPLDFMLEPMRGDQSIIIPIGMNNRKFFCKTFLSRTKQQILSEIEFVETLAKYDVAVMSYLDINSRKVFCFPGFTNCWSYITESVEGERNVVLNNSIIFEIIDEISKMHYVTRKLDWSLSGIDTITDYQKLEQLFIDKQSFFESDFVGRIVENVLAGGHDNYLLYPIHSDLYCRNIMVEDHHFKAFIDFSDLRFSGFEDDLGKFIQSILLSTNLMMREIENFIIYYEKVSHLLISRRNLCISVVYHILELLFLEIDGCEKEDIMIKMDAIRRILSYYDMWR